MKVADLAEVPSGEMVLVDLNGEEVALANVDGAIYAVSDTCTHMAGRLSQGMLEGAIATCPLHSGQFDVRTGEVVSEPPDEPLRTYRVVVNDAGEILVAVD
ncbi:MAG: non-heme iron oxygenase ferredoxin subunit [Dehalococcoidia bacterium]